MEIETKFVGKETAQDKLEELLKNVLTSDVNGAIIEDTICSEEKPNDSPIL
jgi:hypothetical protein